MEISIRPHELAAAATRLTSCARDLETARAEFAARVPADVVALGLKAIEASDRGVELAARAVSTLAEDLHRLADGLRSVAAAYPVVDASAVPKP